MCVRSPSRSRLLVRLASCAAWPVVPHSHTATHKLRACIYSALCVCARDASVKCAVLSFLTLVRAPPRAAACERACAHTSPPSAAAALSVSRNRAALASTATSVCVHACVRFCGVLSFVRRSCACVCVRACVLVCISNGRPRMRRRQYCTDIAQSTPQRTSRRVR